MSAVFGNKQRRPGHEGMVRYIVIQVKLKKGVYHWYQGDKAKETSDLLESLEKELDTNYVIEGADCINEWKLNKDGAFTVSEKSDTIYLTLEYKCYTGTLPCVKYTGPKYQ